MCRTLGVVLLTSLLPGCALRSAADDAERSARTMWTQRAAEADAQAATGCYLPMAEALAGYEMLLAEQDDARLRARAFSVAAMLAVRERLIGLYPGVHQEAPARLAVGLPAAPTQAALDVIDLVRWRAGSGPTPGPRGRVAETDARARHAYETLHPLAVVDPAAAALLIHLVASVPVAGRAVGVPHGEPASTTGVPVADALAEAHPGSASVALALLFASRDTRADDWTAWLEAQPTCVELHVPLADHWLAARRLLSTDASLARALEGLPGLVPARVMRGDIRAMLGDHESALGYFAHVIDVVADHREARLGHLVALSHLGRHEAAVSAADDMVALGEWYLGEAFYWKAWNLYHLGRRPAARAALADARTLLVNAEVFHLEGRIAFEDERWDDARTALTQALGLEADHCDARFLLGAVDLMTRVWASAAETFERAAACFEAREPALAAAVADVADAPLSDAQREALRARRQRHLEVVVAQKQWARYNRAVVLANRGDRDQARHLAEDVAQQTGSPGPAAAAADLLVQLGPDRAPAPPDR